VPRWSGSSVRRRRDVVQRVLEHDRGQAHATLSALARTDVIASVFIGSTLGYPASMVGKQINYAPTLGADGSLGATINGQANGYGLEWGEMLTTGKQSFSTGTVSGTAIDLGATSTLFGAAAYLHVFSVASGHGHVHGPGLGRQPDLRQRHRARVHGATGATSERLQTAAGATIRQYVRIQGPAFTARPWSP
jgi:hypothetical protein